MFNLQNKYFAPMLQQHFTSLETRKSVMRAVWLSLLILVAPSLFATPVITSVAPTEGSVAGGTVVTINGTGFNDTCVICSPPFGGLQVFFGSTQATQIKLINPTKIEAVAPPRPPGKVAITVSVMDGSEPNASRREDAFTYTGNWTAEFEPVLFPIFTPPIQGAFGAEFHTVARVAAESEAFDIFGFDTNCTTIDPPVLPDRPFRIGLGETMLNPACNPGVGRLFFVPAAHAGELAANLRVTDITRQAQSHGVEVPVVRLRDFSSTRIVLLGVPVDPRFRNTLRIYGLPGGTQTVKVTVNGATTVVPLHQPASIYEPSYAQFTAFPANPASPGGTVTVAVDPSADGTAAPTAIWAFVSVTNNDNQQITLVTPN
jgi:hypothetical protein